MFISIYKIINEGLQHEEPPRTKLRWLLKGLPEGTLYQEPKVETLEVTFSFAIPNPRCIVVCENKAWIYDL